MTAAPVGFQCPVCVAEGNRAVARQRGRVKTRSSADYPATKALIVTNVVIYGLAALVGSSQVLLDYGMLGVAIATGDTFRLFTAPFLHAGLVHLGLNMLVLWFLGSALEPALGTVRFLIVYLLSAVAGTVTSYAFSSAVTVSVGASGAIFGLFGSLLLIFLRERRQIGSLLVVLGINLALPLLVPGIDWRAHLGGLLAGALLTGVLVYAPPRSRNLGLGVASVVVAVSLILLAGWRTQELQGFF